MAKGIKPHSDDDEERSHDEESDMNARRSGLRLPLNPLAVPLYNASQSREDVQEGGQILFQNFIREEIHHYPSFPPANAPIVEQALSEAQDYVDVPPMEADAATATSPRYRGTEAFAGIRFTTESGTRASTPEGYKRTDWSKMGRNMRELADSFARSRQGAIVRQQAEGVTLSDINEESFLRLATELFSTGISAERVIALFYFCSTLIIRAAASQKSLDTIRFLFIWSLRFIKDRVCDWVYRNGGWEHVLTNVSKAVFSVTVLALMGTLIVCGLIYIRKNW